MPFTFRNGYVQYFNSNIKLYNVLKLLLLNILCLIFGVIVETKRVYIQLSLCIISIFYVYFDFRNRRATHLSVTV